ncbi:AGE family epimerase/isomerase [Flavihumibacter petaseus]|uniref:Cellobiose 2-epimerase n=1 Tax=Flavihumibacter petaseus NBRC 106054 TaxID=1220578 RepID=A0A0E9N0F4_9BACT|nr:AGE family epimerase/isomerase [Flavihumibacter petaseus]GAO43258.1 putative N-acylglucosamine 2-epimerase [Flavihumibacter petaseus NBRC 106054]
MLFQRLQRELLNELEAILQYWAMHMPDNRYGGFYGRIDENNYVVQGAPKGAVLNARICWTFAAAHRIRPNKEWLALSQRAYHYLNRFFIDPVYGGVCWTVDHTGRPLDTKKQVYAIAFVLYACAAYYRASEDEQALTDAWSLYQQLEQYCLDQEYGGYGEAWSREWGRLDDLRLSKKDANEAKSMNTHLHVLEAYAALYQCRPDPRLKQSIVSLLNLFDQHIIDRATGHLHLFFAANWELRSSTISYGHDIEAGWLLLEAATITGDAGLVEIFRRRAVKLTNAALRGMDADGGLWYEYEPSTQHLVQEKHWWPQAEALVGLFNAWQVTLDESYLQQVLATWKFIQQKIKDKVHGEWFWGVDANGLPLPNQDKAGLWKCPYHNGRACIELLERIQTGIVHTPVAS